MIEIFKQILEIPKYEVSNFGNVRTIYRGELKNIYINKTLKGKAKKPTCLVNLYHEGKKITRNVSILVARAFLPNPNNYKNIIFKDRNCMNCNADNIKWVDGYSFMVYCMGDPNQYSENLLKHRIKKTKKIDEAIKLTENSIRFSIKLLKYYKTGNDKYLISIIEENKNMIYYELLKYFKNTKNNEEHFSEIQLLFLDAVSRNIVIGQNLTGYLQKITINYIKIYKVKNPRGYIPYHELNNKQTSEVLIAK